MGFLERVGAVIASPRAAMRALATTREGGLSDVTVLLALHLVAGEGRVGGTGADSSMILARALLWLGKLEPMLAIQGVLQSVSRLMPDLLAIVIGSVTLALFGGRRSGGRELDLAAAAWIPAIVVKTVGALAFTALGRDPSTSETRWLDATALGWSAACWAVALWTLRAERERVGT